jgi:hypothetical protein
VRLAAAIRKPVAFRSMLLVALILMFGAALVAGAPDQSSDAKEGKAKAGAGEATVKCGFCRSSVPAGT